MNNYCLKRKIYLVLIGLISVMEVVSQEKNFSDIMLSIVEEMALNDQDQSAAEIFLDQLNALAEDPVPINSGDESELTRLFFLNEFQIKSIKDYVTTTGRIVSPYEIALIPGFDRQTAEIMTPFIVFDDNTDSKKGSRVLRNNILINFTVRPDVTDSAHEGSAWKILSKYKISKGKIASGFTLEKDAGEKLLEGNPPLPDFFSGYISYSSERILKKIIFGDFAARYGIGLNLNTSIRTGFLINSTGFMPVRNELKQYTSTDENNFLRGLATELEFKDLNLSLFFSYKKTDATVKMSDDSSSFYISSLYKAGIHNTASLMKKKDAVSEMLTGINITYDFGKMRAGALWSLNKFSIPYYADKKDPENLFKMYGSENQIFSFYYNRMFGKLLVFGEISANNINKTAIIQGITLRPDDRLTINMIYRNYSPRFISLHGNAPGRGSSVSNEKGVTGNFTFEAAKHLFISAACDLSYFPWIKYRCYFPSKAVRQEIRMKYNPTDALNFEISFLNNIYENNLPNRQGVPGIERTCTGSFKIQTRYSLSDDMTLTTRADFRVVAPSGSKGMLLLQDVFYRFRPVPLSLWFRYCIFRSSDWDSRLYAYENDLLYSYNISALSGEGIRTYLMMKWELGDLSEIRLKYGLTTSLTENYKCNNKNEFRMQFRILF